jgi:hypothetical protein
MPETLSAPAEWPSSMPGGPAEAFGTQFADETKSVA